MNQMSALVVSEAKLLFRDQVSWIAAIVLPAAILLIFGAIFAPHRPDPALGGLRWIDTFAPSLVVIATATLAIQTLPIRLATYREKGILRRLSTTPARPSNLLIAQLAVYSVTALVGLVLLIVAGKLAFDVPLPANPIGYVVAFGLGMAALLAIGLLVAAVASSAGVATAIAVPLFFFVMLLGGVYLPRYLLPEIMVRIGELAPPGVQGLQDAWLGSVPQFLPLAVMAAITVGAGAIAVRIFRWE